MRNNFIEHHFLGKNNFGGKKFDFLLKKGEKKRKPIVGRHRDGVIFDTFYVNL